MYAYSTKPILPPHIVRLTLVGRFYEKGFTELENAEVVKKGLLNEIISARGETYVWDLRDGNLIKVPLTLRSTSTQRAQLQFEVESKHAEVLNSLISGSGKLKFYFENQKTAFESDLISFQAPHLTVTLPEKIRKFERRDNPRFEPLFPVKANFSGKKFECVDISLGGFSIVLGTMELPYLKWKEGQELEVEITFVANAYKLKAKIVKAEFMPPYKFEKYMYGAYRVSFMFTDKSNILKAEIEKIAISSLKMLNDL